MNMNAFEYYTPTRVVFGMDAEERAGELCKAFGAKKVLIHYGGGSAVRSGLIERVKASLNASGLQHAELSGVVPNPELSKVYEGIELAKREGVDFILAVGGGSVIDSSKAIAYGLANPENDVWDFYLKKAVPKAAYPVGAILTIAAAGSEMSNSSVITNEKTGEKRGCNHDICRCKFAIMNPELTKTLPDYQTEAGCADIMMHTMERYFTGKGNMELTDALAEGLLKTVMRNAELLHKEPENIEARAEVMWASSLSHNGLTGCGNGGDDFASHRIEHELSGMFGVTHGAGLCAVWPSWARYVHKDCLDRFVEFALNVMGVEKAASDEETALLGIEAMEDFYHRIGMPVSLRELIGKELSEDEIKTLAANCERAVGGHIGSAKLLGRADFEEIYRMAI